MCAYVGHLKDLGNARASILARVQELDAMARIIEPDGDWQFIRKIESKVRAQPDHSHDRKLAKLASTEELYALGRQLMVEAATASTPRLAAISFRDGLVIALLALRPMRRRNLAGLHINQTLLRFGEDWHICVEADQTKTHEPIEWPWPEALASDLETYLNLHHPVLSKGTGRWAYHPAKSGVLPASEDSALWVSAHGTAMTGMALYQQIRIRTAHSLGKAINPHMFRHAAATTLAIEDPDHVRMASSLLGHRSQATTERYYQMAQSLTASRIFNEALMALAETPHEE